MFFDSDTLVSDDPNRIRTCDRTLRRRMLYPAELLDQSREFQQELIWLYVDSRCVLSIIIDRSIIS